MGRFLKTALLVACSGAIGLLTPANSQNLVQLRASFLGGSATLDGAPSVVSVASSRRSQPPLLAPVSLPRMAPELTLQQYQRRAVRQSGELVGYSASSTVHAELPELSERAEFVLNRHFTAPKTLQFTPVQFTGDGFVKTNVIARLLQSEVDHLQKDQPAQTAITDQNYKFSYKGAERMNDRLVHIYQLKPRKKRPGLFKGHVFIDAFTGSIVRAEGRMVKSPSIFIKNIDFVQDYADFGSFTFPVHMHSEAKARLIGRVVVDVFHRDYQTMPSSEVQTAGLPSSSSAVTSASN